MTAHDLSNLADEAIQMQRDVYPAAQKHFPPDDPVFASLTLSCLQTMAYTVSRESTSTDLYAGFSDPDAARSMLPLYENLLKGLGAFPTGRRQ